MLPHPTAALKSTRICCTPWRNEFRHDPGNAFPRGGKRRWDETKVAQLERKVGQQTVEIDFLKGCLQRIEEERMLQAADFRQG